MFPFFLCLPRSLSVKWFELNMKNPPLAQVKLQFAQLLALRKKNIAMTPVQTWITEHSHIDMATTIYKEFYGT